MINLKTKKILVPYDFSETSENAVKHAALIAALTKGELIILNVQNKNELLNILLPILNIKKPSEISEFLAEKLSNEASRIEKKYGVKTSSIFSTGRISTEIISICDELKVVVHCVQSLFLQESNSPSFGLVCLKPCLYGYVALLLLWLFKFLLKMLI